MRFLSSAVLLAAAAVPLVAQDPPPTEERKRTIGFGVTVSPSSLFIDEDIGFLPGLANILIPLRVNPKFTMEMELGFLSFSSSSSGGGFSGSGSFSATRMGVGFLGELGPQGPLNPYLGVRVLRVTLSSESVSGSFSESSTNSGWTFGGVIGAQHFFSPGFSLGGEVQLARTSFGNPETSGSGGTPSSEQKSSMVSTNGLVIVRWFP